jgi:two-component system, chemotaxis family, chemotaxis protein CheY
MDFEDIDETSDRTAALNKMREKNAREEEWADDIRLEHGTDDRSTSRSSQVGPPLTKTPFIIVTAESKTESVIAAK